MSRHFAAIWVATEMNPRKRSQVCRVRKRHTRIEIGRVQDWKRSQSINGSSRAIRQKVRRQNKAISKTTNMDGLESAYQSRNKHMKSGVMCKHCKSTAHSSLELAKHY